MRVLAMTEQRMFAILKNSWSLVIRLHSASVFSFSVCFQWKDLFSWRVLAPKSTGLWHCGMCALHLQCHQARM